MHELNRKRIEAYLGLINQTIQHRYSMLTGLPAMAAGFLVIASFNEKLIPITTEVRVLISLLIVCIPTGFHYMHWRLDYDEKNILDSLRKEGISSSDSDKGWKTPYLFVAIVYIFSAWIIKLIWCH